MGCCASSEEYGAADASPSHVELAMPPPSPAQKRRINDQARGKFEQDVATRNESTAQDVVNELTRASLPSVRYGIGKIVQGWTKTGLRFDGGCLSVVNELDPAGELDPLNVIDRLLLRMLHVLVQRDRSTHSRLSMGSRVSSAEVQSPANTSTAASKPPPCDVSPLPARRQPTNEEKRAALRTTRGTPRDASPGSRDARAES